MKKIIEKKEEIEKINFNFRWSGVLETVYLGFTPLTEQSNLDVIFFGGVILKGQVEKGKKNTKIKVGG